MDWSGFPRGSTRGTYRNPTAYAAVSECAVAQVSELRSRPLNAVCFRCAERTGQEWIRTTEGDASGFTVRPVWPLRYLPVS